MLSWVPSPSGTPDILPTGAVAATSLPEGWKMLISPHTPPHAPGTLSPSPSRPCKDAKHMPSASPLLPVTEGPRAKVWGSPSFSIFTSCSYVFTSILTVGTDALPLFWEFYSGGGVICGASMHYDWNSFIYVPILLEAVALLPTMTVRGTMVRSEVCNSWCFCLES